MSGIPVDGRSSEIALFSFPRRPRDPQVVILSIEPFAEFALSLQAFDFVEGWDAGHRDDHRSVRPA
jgi:hypothetical protein